MFLSCAFQVTSLSLLVVRGRTPPFHFTVNSSIEGTNHGTFIRAASYEAFNDRRWLQLLTALAPLSQAIEVHNPFDDARVPLASRSKPFRDDFSNSTVQVFSGETPICLEEMEAWCSLFSDQVTLMIPTMTTMIMFIPREYLSSAHLGVRSCATTTGSTTALG